MSKTALILKRDYLAGVRRKAFLVMTLAGPLFLLAMAAFIVFMFKYNIQDSKPLAVYDETGLFQNVIHSHGFMKFDFLPTDGFQEAKDKIQADGQYAGLLHIASTAKFDANYTQSHIQLFSVRPVSTSITTYLEGSFNKFLTNYKLQRSGVDLSRIKAAKTKVKIRSKNFENQDTGRVSTVAIPISYLFIFLMYFFVFIYGVRVMRSVLEEKVNRIVEVVISSVKPVQLMLGKIFSSALVGLTQFSIWALLLGLAALLFGHFFSTDLSQASASIPQQSSQILEMAHDGLSALGQMNISLLVFSFVFYFVFGVLTYNSIFAAIGAAVDNQTDTQQFLLVVSIPVAIALYGSFSIAQNPDGAVGFWLSMIPLTSPIAMMARIPFGVPFWQLALSMTLLVAFFSLMVWLAARIYRVGILMYGKKSGWKELYKWLKY